MEGVNRRVRTVAFSLRGKFENQEAGNQAAENRDHEENPAVIHGQVVDHPVADRQNRFSAFAGRMVAGYFVEEQMFNAVGGEIEEDCCTAGNQADQDTQDDRARQDAQVEFFQVVDEVIEIGHG